jgi:glycosyltransferase involved in cell wall biosynthesis
MSNITGIYYLAPIFDIGGYGTVARNYLLAMKELGLPIFIHNHGAPDTQVVKDNADFVDSISVKNPDELGDKVALIYHCDPRFIKPFNSPKIVKNIGMSIFETDRIAPEWAENLNKMDEIWVPTQFNYETFKNSGCDESKMKIVRYCIDTRTFNDNTDYGTLDYLGNDLGFIFTYVSAYDHRKGYELLIDSFCEAFTKDDDVTLLLKIFIPDWSDEKQALSELTQRIMRYKDRPRILISNARMSNKDLLSLYNMSDAYISTERASGWGMPEMEMMAMGKPVASIHWGGTTEYMNSSNSYPIYVSGELEPVDMRLQTHRPTYAGHKWACVDKKDVVKSLREIYFDNEKRERISKKAKEDVTTILSPKAIAKELERALED